MTSKTATIQYKPITILAGNNHALVCYEQSCGKDQISHALSNICGLHRWSCNLSDIIRIQFITRPFLLQMAWVRGYCWEAMESVQWCLVPLPLSYLDITASFACLQLSLIPVSCNFHVWHIHTLSSKWLTSIPGPPNLYSSITLVHGSGRVRKKGKSIHHMNGDEMDVRGCIFKFMHYIIVILKLGLSLRLPQEHLMCRVMNNPCLRFSSACF